SYFINQDNRKGALGVHLVKEISSKLNHVTEISETLCPGKNLPKNTPPKTKNDQISALIP
ncbi:6245_t:CDS:2, partial [Funneliformis mosseae]